MSRQVTRRLAAAVVVAAAVAGFSAIPADASHRGYVDGEMVQLQRAGTVRGEGGLALHLTARSAVAATNYAVARVTCDGCRATAVSFQVVVADRDPASVDAQNLSYAKDDSCASCEARSYAYQFVLVFQGDARLSVAGRQQLDRVDQALKVLARSGRSADEIQTAADAYAAQVADILGSEIKVRPLVRKQIQKR